MVIHTDSFANERRFVCILKCRRTRQTRVVSGWTLLRCLKGNCLWVTDMWASHLLGPHVMDTKAGALRHRSIVLSGWSRVSDGRVAPSHPPPSPPKKGRRQYKFALPRFGLKYLAAPIPALQNLSSPPSPSAPRLLKSLIRRQPSNRPSSRLFPHLCAGRRRRRRRSRFTTAPELPHLRPRPPHRVVHRQRRPPQPTCLTDTEFHRIRCASPTPSPSSPGLLHRAHRRTSAPRGRWGFTNGLVHRIVALRCHSRSASVRGQPTPAHHPQRL